MRPSAGTAWTPNVLLVALKGACRNGVLHDGEPFIEERGGAAIGGQGLAFGASLQQQLKLGGSVLAATGPTYHAPAIGHDERGNPAAIAGASVDRTLALATSPCRHAAAPRRSRDTYS
jgi:hypothetical protein